jgi:hypothetical protein
VPLPLPLLLLLLLLALGSCSWLLLLALALALALALDCYTNINPLAGECGGFAFAFALLFHLSFILKCFSK